MVICGCPDTTTIPVPEKLVELCPTPETPSPLIKIEGHKETIVKNCFNSLAIGFSRKSSCGGMDCGE